MSMTKRHIESLPEEEQNQILGNADQDEEAYWAAYDNDCHTIKAGDSPDEYPDYGNILNCYGEQV